MARIQSIGTLPLLSSSTGTSSSTSTSTSTSTSISTSTITSAHNNNNNSNNDSSTGNNNSRWKELLWKIPPTTTLIIGICCFLHVAIQMMVVVEDDYYNNNTNENNNKNNNNNNINNMNQLLSYYTLQPYKVLNRFQIYRLVSCSFLHGDFVHLVMNMMSVYAIGPTLERRIGSIRFFLLTILSAILYTPGLYIGLSLLLQILFQYRFYYMHSQSIGFSGVLFHWLVLECSTGSTNGSSTNNRSVFGFVQVPAYMYPWVLLVVIQCFMPNVSFLGHLSGILIGTYPYQFHSQQYCPSLIPINESYLHLIDEHWYVCRYLSSHHPNYIRTTTIPTASTTMMSRLNTTTSASTTMSYCSIHSLRTILDRGTTILYYVYETIYVAVFGGSIRSGGRGATGTGSDTSNYYENNDDDDDDWNGLPIVQSSPVQVSTITKTKINHCSSTDPQMV